MAIRDILDYNGDVIGQLELPDDTSEQVWAEKLAAYIMIPKSMTQRYIDKQAAQRAKSAEVMAQIRLWMIENVTTLADAADIYNKMAPELLAVNNGAFEIAIYMLQTRTPSGAVSQDFLNKCIEILQNNVVPA